MTYTVQSVQSFLAGIEPFDRLPSNTLDQLAEKFQWLRYRMGQAIAVREQLPAHITILYEGQARLLGYDPQTKLPVTLKLLQPKDVLGSVSLVRGIACETAIASTELVCLHLPAADFLQLLDSEPAIAAFRARPSLIETFDLLGAEPRNGKIVNNLQELAVEAVKQAIVRYLPPGKTALDTLDSNRTWFVSGGGELLNFPVGSCLNFATQTHVEVARQPTRIVGFLGLEPESNTKSPITNSQLPITNYQFPIPYAPAVADSTESQSKRVYPFVRGRGAVDATIACCQMLSQHLGMPFRRSVIRRVLDNQLERTGSLSLQTFGVVAELMGLNVQLVNVPSIAVTKLQTPAAIAWQDSFAILYEVSDREIVLALPETGILRKKPAELIAAWDNQIQVLLLQPTKETPQQRFGLSWFLPSLTRYRKVLLEVFIASFFVQLFGLANPLTIQIIIDKVLVQNSPDTLQVLGIFLLVVAVFEAVLTSLRTYLFVDTTNRIDMALGSEIIDHLLRLPLRYFERRPVGELATRVNELENIRSFLTSTALTVVLDAVFSVIYIVVMVVYSWQLTLVTLATIPLFAAITFIVSPIVRRQLRIKAERNAETQSHLVEVLSGIQTVKAQNIELRSRWQWQQQYARYVSAGFKTVLTFTAASSTSNFLNQLSGLLVIWVGAYLVLKGELTLGQLIAFRIIAGYVTSPLLRLVQLWQNFQETALSLERLSDIIDTPQEVSESDRQNIPIPAIEGDVIYENVSFRFAPSGALQLSQVNLHFPPGMFVGIVGTSGSGKSTLMKLLPRLYEPTSGRIIVDGYDISKVELYSLRSQVGIVPQDSLLFKGTVQENIALTHPDASPEEIVAAAKLAIAHEFIMNLPNGYNTNVGERGSALSGGQRQRIAIARTILQNPRILILDEATSSLDYDTEWQLCQNLATAFRDRKANARTVFFITHRLGTIRDADAIVVMDKGSVVEQGNHEELMALRGRYYCLYLQQEK